MSPGEDHSKAVTSDGLEIAWLASGAVGFPRMLDAIESATRLIRLEMYLIQPSPIAEEFLIALLQSVRRGVHVRVLVDAVGSSALPESFFAPLIDAGGEVRRFNRWGSSLVLARDHRKLLICDESVGYVVGFNLAPEYAGDGVESGWRDVGLEIRGASVGALARIFDAQFLSAVTRPRSVIRVRPRREQTSLHLDNHTTLFPVSPGIGLSRLMQAMLDDVQVANDMTLVTPYFIPPPPLRRALRRAVKRGARVRLILPGESDVPLAKAAARHLYSGLLRAGVEIWEYQPQILHAKLLLLDDVLFLGSSNLDQRSLHLNFEVMLRLNVPAIVDIARDDAENMVQFSRRIDKNTWRKSRSWSDQLRDRWAYFMLNRVDPWVTWRFLSETYR